MRCCSASAAVVLVTVSIALHIVPPVSYTHLDVYKRQVLLKGNGKNHKVVFLIVPALYVSTVLLSVRFTCSLCA